MNIPSASTRPSKPARAFRPRVAPTHVPTKKNHIHGTYPAIRISCSTCQAECSEHRQALCQDGTVTIKSPGPENAPPESTVSPSSLSKESGASYSYSTTTSAAGRVVDRPGESIIRYEEVRRRCTRMRRFDAHQYFLILRGPSSFK